MKFKKYPCLTVKLVNFVTFILIIKMAWFSYLDIFIVLFVIIVVYVHNNRDIFKLSWQLSGPIAWPIFGNAFSFLCRDEDLFDRAVSLTSKYPSPMRVWFGPKFAFVVMDVVQAEKIMSSMKFATKDKMYKFMAVFNGEALISGSGPKWKRDRRLMTPLFLKRNVIQHFPYILSHTKILVKILKGKVDQPTFNVIHSIHRCAADFVNETIIGVKTNAQGGELENLLENLTRMYTVVHARMMKVWLQVDWIFRFTKYKKLEEDGKQIIHGFFREAIKMNKETHVCTTKNDQSFRNLLDQMLDIRDDVPNFATDEELVHHLSTLYSASEDTVTTMTSFVLLLLGMYPNIQNKVVEEIMSVVGERDIEEPDLAKLVYLDMVVKDTLRLFPIAPFIARESSQDFQLDKWTIPKGCTVVVSIQNIHRDGKLWEKPDEFYPEHFLPEAVEKRHPYAFLPFSAGPRGCLGKPYAYMAMKIILVTILQNYVVEADGKLEDIQLKTDISVRTKDEIYPIRIKKRKKNDEL